MKDLGGPDGRGIGGVGNEKKTWVQGDRRCNEGADVCEHTPMTCWVRWSGIADRGLPALNSGGARIGMIGHDATSFHVTLVGSSQAHAEGETPDRLHLQQEEDGGAPELHMNNLTLQASICEYDRGGMT
jgi:hypothetical protein